MTVDKVIKGPRLEGAYLKFTARVKKKSMEGKKGQKGWEVKVQRILCERRGKSWEDHTSFLAIK